jgi:hypothetical protein
MRKLASERGKGVRSRPGGGGKCVENRKKILNRGNEPKNILIAKELAFSRGKNELVFERKKAQSKRKMGQKSGKWKLEIRNSKIAGWRRLRVLGSLRIFPGPGPGFSLSRGERVTRVRRFHQPARVG